ncbi:hypothetical protein CYMTET_24423, partial [Cymbomonas tetramitiformis]
GVKHLRTLLVSDWGPSQEDTGGVSSLAWSPDEKALAVGWSARGMAVWSASGCRLMCTIRQGKGGTASHGDWHSSLPSPTLTPLSLHSAAGPKQLEALRTGVAGLCWDHHGYSLIAAENGSARRLVQFTMAKMVEQRRVVHGSPSVQMLQGADRLLLVAEGEDGVPTLQHLIVPSTYMATNWPVRHVAVAPTGQDIAVAGKRGITLYNTASRKWRVFGDIRQERQVAATALLWLPKIIGVCNELSGGKHELLFYPRYHLDNQSLLLRHPLPGGAPLALDSQGDILLEAAAPFDVRIYRAVVVGELSPLKSPTLRLQPLRELSTMSYRRPPLCLALVPSLACTPSNADGAASSAPTRCMVLRVGGELSILDLAAGSEQTLSNGVENFWLTLPKHGSGKAARSDASNASQSNGAQSKTANGSAGATPSPSGVN